MMHHHDALRPDWAPHRSQDGAIKPHRRGDAVVFSPATTSFAIGDPVKGDCGADEHDGIALSPAMKRKSLLPGATGERSASLARAGFSNVDACTGDLHRKCKMFINAQVIDILKRCQNASTSVHFACCVGCLPNVMLTIIKSQLEPRAGGAPKQCLPQHIAVRRVCVVTLLLHWRIVCAALPI